MLLTIIFFYILICAIIAAAITLEIDRTNTIDNVGRLLFIIMSPVLIPVLFIYSVILFIRKK